jgi:hypothetical protein
MKHLGGNQYFLESDLRRNFVNFSARSEEMAKSLITESVVPRGSYDIFLSHSSADMNVINGLYRELIGQGFSVFVDRIDAKGTAIEAMADKLKSAMNKSKYILYVHTHNSKNSKWTPWEIGYFDSKKGKDNIFVMPLLNDTKEIAPYIGQEYLQAYTEISADYLDSLKDSSSCFGY